MQGRALDDGNRTYIGVDVSKARLDFWLCGEAFSAPNDDAGIRELLGRLDRLRSAMVVMEATGRLHEPLWAALDAAGVAAVVVNPLHARQFAGALGKLAKTDVIDAQVLAEFGRAKRPDPTPAPSETMFRIKRLHFARGALLVDLLRSRNRAASARDPFVAKSANAQVAFLKGQVDAFDRELQKLVRKDENARRVFEIVTSVPGMGPQSALALIAEMPELGSASAKKIAALAGLAPMNCDSGVFRGQAKIKGGRASVRKVLYMAALTAGWRNPNFEAVRKRLMERGKPAKVAIIAVARKLLVLVNSLVRENREWKPISV